MDILALLEAEVGGYARNSADFEIGGQTVKVYAKPMTPADLTEVSRKHPGFSSAPTPAGMITMLIRKATDEDGKRMFTLLHQELLNAVKVDKLGALFSALFGEQMDDQTVDDAAERKKN
jgi:hypothetical protein